MKEEEYSWILGSPNITMTKMENLNVSIVMYTDTWQRIVESQRRRKKPESATNVIKQNTSQKTAGQNRR